MSMFDRKTSREQALAEGKASKAAERAANRKPKEPRLHERAPEAMAAGLSLSKEFDSKTMGGTAVQVKSAVWPNTISFPVTELATTGLAVVNAICEKIGKGRKGKGLSAEDVQDRLLDFTRTFSDGEGMALITQSYPPNFVVPVGQDSEALKEGCTRFLTELAEGIESGNEAVLDHMETLRAEGVERKAKSDLKREEKKAAKIKAEAEAEVAAKAAK